MKSLLIWIVIVTLMIKIQAGKFNKSKSKLFQQNQLNHSAPIELTTVAGETDVENVNTSETTTVEAPKDVTHLIDEDDEEDSDYPFPDDSDAEYKKRCQDKFNTFLTLC